MILRWRLNKAAHLLQGLRILELSGDLRVTMGFNSKMMTWIWGYLHDLGLQDGEPLKVDLFQAWEMRHFLTGSLAGKGSNWWICSVFRKMLQEISKRVWVNLEVSQNCGRPLKKRMVCPIPELVQRTIKKNYLCLGVETIVSCKNNSLHQYVDFQNWQDPHFQG